MGSGLGRAREIRDVQNVCCPFLVGGVAGRSKLDR